MLIAPCTIRHKLLNFYEIYSIFGYHQGPPDLLTWSAATMIPNVKLDSVRSLITFVRFLLGLSFFLPRLKLILLFISLIEGFFGFASIAQIHELRRCFWNENLEGSRCRCLISAYLMKRLAGNLGSMFGRGLTRHRTFWVRLGYFLLSVDYDFQEEALLVDCILNN